MALSEDGMCIFHKEDFDGHKHAENIGPFVDEAMSFADSHAIPLDAVAVSSGPGSYTGLRIGVSMAKGICYALDLKLIAIPTLQLLAVPVLLQMEMEDEDEFVEEKKSGNNDEEVEEEKEKEEETEREENDN